MLHPKDHHFKFIQASQQYDAETPVLLQQSMRQTINQCDFGD